MLTPVGTPDELDAFVTQFRLDSLADEIRTDATTASYDGRALGRGRLDRL